MYISATMKHPAVLELLVWSFVQEDSSLSGLQILNCPLWKITLSFLALLHFLVRQAILPMICSCVVMSYIWEVTWSTKARVKFSTRPSSEHHPSCKRKVSIPVFRSLDNILSYEHWNNLPTLERHGLSKSYGGSNSSQSRFRMHNVFEVSGIIWSTLLCSWNC